MFVCVNKLELCGDTPSMNNRGTMFTVSVSDLSYSITWFQFFDRLRLGSF